MAEAFLGEIRLFGFNFAPVGWAFCNGQLLPISENQALFALLGTIFGGNGTTTFALPNLQSRVPIHFGQGPGLTPYVMGESAGTETITLTSQQMPQHNHTVNVVGSGGNSDTPKGNVLAKASSPNYSTSAPDGSTMNPSTISFAGKSQPFSIIQPYLAVNFCIALQGIFPSRN